MPREPVVLTVVWGREVAEYWQVPPPYMRTQASGGREAHRLERLEYNNIRPADG